MATIDWDLPVRTKHSPPLIGEVGTAQRPDGRRAVALPSLSQKEAGKWPTVYFYPQDGVARYDRAPTEHDLENFDPRDGVFGIRIVRGER